MKREFWSNSLSDADLKIKWARGVMRAAFGDSGLERWLAAIEEGLKRWGSGYFWNAPSGLLFLLAWNPYDNVVAVKMEAELKERSWILRGRSGFQLKFRFSPTQPLAGVSAISGRKRR